MSAEESATVEVSDADFEQVVLQSDKPVVVDYWAEWCGPCRQIAPALDEIAQEMAGKVVIAKVQADDNPEYAMKYGVRGLPTLLLFKDGELVSQQVGAASKNALAAWIAENA